ncbi:hypothetical protein, variant [Phialophora macrospora]|uniref:Uncharacterized protein n=1 Tax=Phialophora macrospora TaxID=1851006 RepID=A0A0D2FSI2_9EURO|nr:hypothetical protein, variant [Phialophora macrospora]
MSQTQTAEAQNSPAWEANASDAEPSPPRGGRKAPKLQQAMQKRPASDSTQSIDAEDEAMIAPPAARGRRIVPVHQSRIQDRPAKVGEKDSSLKIKIELDLEVEVEIYARVKGDVTIGLL